MRRFLTILALTAVVAAPSLSIAKNPFDFSDWVKKSRSETWTAEDSPASAAPDHSQAESPPLQPKAPPLVKNYADELFGEPQPSPAAAPPSKPTTQPSPAAAPLSNPPTRPSPWTPEEYRHQRSAVQAPVGRPRLQDRPAPAARFTRDDLNSRKSEDTLQRFDEFLKSRDVVHAELEDAGGSPAADKIQRVAETRVPVSAADTVEPVTAKAEPVAEELAPVAEELAPVAEESNSRGAEENLWELKRSASPRRNITADQDSRAGADDGPKSDERFSFLEDVPADAADAGNRLTEAISTTPVSRFTEPQQSPAHANRSEQNPFAFEEEAPKPTPAEPTVLIDAASGSQEGKSRFSISRAAATPSVEAPIANHTLSSVSAPAPAPAQRTASITAVLKPKGPFNVGQECPCELLVTNTRKVPADDVSVETRLPNTLQLVDAVPAPMVQDGVFSWQLNSLEPGEERSLQLVLVARQTGPVQFAAWVRSTDAHVQSLTVAEPQLDVTVTGPTDVTVGEPATQTVVVRNPGSGVATNVKLEARVPEGLEHVRGNRLVMDIGSLNPGETRRVRLALAAVGGGPQILEVEARADSGLVQTAAAEVTVAAPKLKAAIDGPGLRYLGREATYTLHVENEGVAATDAVQMVHRIPEGFDFVRSDRGARYDQSSRMLTWFVGRLGSEQPQELHVTLLAKQAGEFVHAVRAASEHGSYSDAQMTTRVEGTASLVMEVSDLDDPVEVGVETAYEVTITNEGTASSHDVTLACELPAGLTFLSAAGPSEHRAGANSVAFQSVAEVGAGESLTYRVTVKGTDVGDRRFRCRLTSANLSQPLFTEELTKFYGE